MNQQEQLIYLVGYLKASIEYLTLTASKESSSKMFYLMSELEQYLNQEIKKIFHNN